MDLLTKVNLVYRTVENKYLYGIQVFYCYIRPLKKPHIYNIAIKVSMTFMVILKYQKSVEIKS